MLAVLSLAVLSYAGIKVGPEVYDLVVGCGADICCESCDLIPVSRVIDGDTFVSAGARVRTYGYDAPGVGQRCAAEATERLRELVGQEVRAELWPQSNRSL